jgi:chromosome segregation ATPase
MATVMEKMTTTTTACDPPLFLETLTPHLAGNHMNIFSQLKAALAEKETILGDLASAQNSLTEATALIEAKNGLIAELEAAAEGHSLKVSELEQLASDHAASLEAAKVLHAEEISKLTEVKEALEETERQIDEEVAAATIDQVAALGFEASALPLEADAATNDPASIYDQWNSLKGSAKTSFFREHKAVLQKYDAERSKK